MQLWNHTDGDDINGKMLLVKMNIEKTNCGRKKKRQPKTNDDANML